MTRKGAHDDSYRCKYVYHAVIGRTGPAAPRDTSTVLHMYSTIWLYEDDVMGSSLESAPTSTPSRR